MKTLPLLLTTWLLAGQAPAESPPSAPVAAPEPKPAADAAPAAAPAPAAPAPSASSEPASPPPAPAEPAPASTTQPALVVPKAPRLLVLDVADKGSGPEVAAAVSAAVAAQAIRSHAGEVVSTQQLKIALDAAAMQALVGCDAPACMTDVAGQVEAARVLGGSVARVGEDLLLTLLVVEAATGARIEELTRKVPAYEDMYYYAAKEMTSLLLTGAATESRVPVRVTASEPGARVIVDGQVRGTAPTTLKLDPGSHEVRVEADGFASWRTLADVREGTPLALSAELVAERLPLWPAALVVGGVALGAATGAAWTGAVALDRYDGSMPTWLPDWLFLGERGPGRSYRHGAPTDSLTLAQRKVEVETWQLASNVLWGTAGVLLLSAVALETGDLLLGAAE